MKSIDLKGTVRENLGKNGSKKIRANESVPCILYGGDSTVYFSVIEKDLKPIIFTPDVYLINLEVEGKKYVAKIQEIQYHPVTDSPMHIDFLQVSDKKKIEIELPVKVEGNSVGVKEGGKLVQDLRKLRVKGFIKDIPDYVTIDVTELGLGKSMRVPDLTAQDFEFLNFKNSPVVSVKMTRAARGAAEVAAKTGK